MLEKHADHPVATSHLTYPFEHGLGRISLSHFLLAKMPLTQSLSETLDAGSDMQSNMDDLMRACIARLGALAEKVENFFGFRTPRPSGAEGSQEATSKEQRIGRQESFGIFAVWR